MIGFCYSLLEKGEIAGGIYTKTFIVVHITFVVVEN